LVFFGPKPIRKGEKIMLENFAVGTWMMAGIILIGTILAAMIWGIIDKIDECKLKKISIRNDKIWHEITLINNRLYNDPKIGAICERIKAIITRKQNIQNIDEFIDSLSKIESKRS